eukprot:TRINITY_DN5539_c0_g1_i2.p1 TRINITY_DN5539_c0_g1~~TRINITY_DN5539_c0_g1_i2.p1  ORF type:complete len:277 (-),score=43.04 TRINITY_DN5539_c0_g1_i2:390-1220(-)
MNFDISTTKQLPVVSPNSNVEVYAELEEGDPTFYNSIPVQPDLEEAKRKAPVPVYREINEEMKPFFIRPTSYIFYNEDNYGVEYEADTDDEKWLETFNRSLGRPKSKLTCEQFERDMETLERTSFEFAGNATNDEQDKDEVLDSDCFVCKEGLSEDTNQIVFCDGCDIAVHQCCYGIRSIPEGSWRCQVCAEKGDRKSLYQDCSLCSMKGGAMKRINKTRDEWVHVQCALFIPEVAFEERDCGGNVYYRKKIDPADYPHVCRICKKKNEGFAVLCS